ncbi:hypothetical protein QJQ45_017505 [Haematococcus lacustris]|nr:hypothetical protein QJQ45_017505 [Haematococcus lacustris]
MPLLAKQQHRRGRSSLADAQKTGVASEAVKQAGSKLGGQMAVAEAQLILGVDPKMPWGEVVKRGPCCVGTALHFAVMLLLQRYKHLFEVNEKHGSFYLQSKVYRARERLEKLLHAAVHPGLQEYEAEGRKTSDGESPSNVQQRLPGKDN